MPDVTTLTPGEMLLGALGAVGTVASTVIGWNASRMADKLDKHQETIAQHGERIVRIESSSMHERLDKHDARLQTLEKEVSGISADVKVIRSILERK